MIAIKEDENDKRRARNMLRIKGWTEKEIDDLEKAMREDRNLSRFTDPEIITVKKAEKK